MTDAPNSSAAPRVISIDFKRRGHLKKIPGYRGLYKYPNEDGFYIRPVVDDIQRCYKLKATTVTKADQERARLISQLARYHVGLDKNPFARADAISVNELGQFYKSKNCPRKNTVKQRSLSDLKAEKLRVDNINTWPRSKHVGENMTAGDWRVYREWRKKRLGRKARGAAEAGDQTAGDRAVDKERVTLSNIFRCAIRHSEETGVRTNPVIAHNFEKFRDSDLVVHCRDHMPRTGDELHAIARILFQLGARSEVLGWFCLFCAFIGHRATHMLKLRIDAASSADPGFLEKRGAEGPAVRLWLYRSKTSKGTFDHADVDAPLRYLLEAHAAWHRRRYSGSNGRPASAWYFPSPENPAKPIDAGSLTHRLVDVCDTLKLPKRTTQGLRAFFINVLRSEGKSLEEAAIRAGHKSLGKLILSTYGEPLPYKLSRMPAEDPPAWSVFDKGEIYVQDELDLGVE